MQTLAEIRANIADTTRESQINSLIDSFKTPLRLLWKKYVSSLDFQ